MKTWLGKIRIWEIALLILAGFVSHFVFTLETSQKQITSKTVDVISHVDKSLTNIDTTVSGIGTSTNVTLALLDSDTLKLGNTIDRINALCTPVKGQVSSVLDSKNCGLLSDLSRTLQTLRGTIGTVETAGLNFDKHQTDLYNQEQLLFTHTDNMIDGFAPIQTNLNKTIFDVDGAINSQDFTGTVHHFNTITGNLGDMSTTANTKFQSFMNPPPCKGFKCHLVQDIQILKAGAQFAEPAYWTYELIKAIP